MRKSLMATMLLLGTLISQTAGAATTPCPQFFANGQAPTVLNPKLGPVIEICKGGFEILYSGTTMGSIASSDYLTRETLQIPRERRHDVWHSEDTLPPGINKTYAEDWKMHGLMFDKGHMVPNEDMWSPELQAETFTYANIVPQDADNNEILHEGIETAVRNLGVETGAVYVVTGPIFDILHDSSKRGARLNGKALIPSGIFKAVYIPSLGKASAYVERNAPGPDYQVVSINALTQLIDIDVFPGLSDAIKSEVINLPRPHSHFHSSRESRAENRRPEGMGNEQAPSPSTTEYHNPNAGQGYNQDQGLMHNLLHRLMGY
jgi:endonuclease G, mitochondrial